MFGKEMNDDELKALFECHHWMDFKKEDITTIKTNLTRLEQPELTNMRQSIGMFLITSVRKYTIKSI